jgi:hypothetical protein
MKIVGRSVRPTCSPRFRARSTVAPKAPAIPPRIGKESTASNIYAEYPWMRSNFPSDGLSGAKQQRGAYDTCIPSLEGCRRAVGALWKSAIPTPTNLLARRLSGCRSVDRPNLPSSHRLCCAQRAGSISPLAALLSGSVRTPAPQLAVCGWVELRRTALAVGVFQAKADRPGMHWTQGAISTADAAGVPS